MEGEVVGTMVVVSEIPTVLLVGGDIVSLTVGVAERSIVLPVGSDIVSMTVGVTDGDGLSRVCLAGGDIVSVTLRVGVKVVKVVAEVTEGVGSVCFMHVWEKEG